MSRMSVATIDNPEFINLQPLDINPLMSACEIKVFYLGQNRNRSAISKDVATEMAKTLRGAPIVGWYKEEKGDFIDHGERITYDGEGLHFDCMTRPYGFVAPDAKVWFQKFEETDAFGNAVIREYLMTTGYLWTGQYEEAKLAIEEGRPHSMELDDDTLEGEWAQDFKTGIEFFIVNDAIFSKLCILGEDVEPCFEGSSVTKPDISMKFSKSSDDFKHTLFTMMQELKFALQGGEEMANTLNGAVVEPKVQDAAPSDFTATQDKDDKNSNAENQKDMTDSSLTEEAPSDFKKDDDKKEEKEEQQEESSKEEDNKDKEDEDEKKKYSLLEEKFTALEQKYSKMEKEYENLVAFKNSVDNEKKDALIKSFYMLSDEDKKDIIENKSKYSLDEIEAKLSVICFRKKVSFDSEEQNKKETPATTFSLESTEESNVPEWVQACRNTQNQLNS